jgi:GDP-4-dehydro-6-deoxy-D-mannose reductase
MRTLVTGANGFAGSYLVDLLVGQGHEVVALVQERDRRGNISQLSSRSEIVEGDVRDAHRMMEILRETRPERLYHLAAVTSPVQSLHDPRLTYEVNFQGTLNLLCAWRELKLLGRLLYVSSSHVYGEVRNEDMPLREDIGLRPADPYGASKAAAELLADQFFRSYLLQIVRVRPFNHTGPGQSGEFVCSNLARQIAEINLGLRPPVVKVGNLSVRRDFSDVRDIVRGYYLLIENGKPGDVYQLCSGHPVSVEELLQVLLDLSPKKIEIQVEESRLRLGEAPAVWGDPTKARQAVSWQREYQMARTMKDLMRYWETSLTPGTPKP